MNRTLRNRNILSKDKGSFLLEALVSVVILSISISLIIQSMTSGLRASLFVEDATLALIKMDNVLTNIKSGSIASTDDEGKEDEKYRINIEESSEVNLKQFKVAAEWKSGIKNQSIDVSTYAYPTQEK